MLTIRAAKNPGYYEQQEFARDDYYTERGSVPGRWVGRSAKTLELSAPLERGQLGTLLEGKSPITGQQLPGGRGRKPSNAGFDLTFTAPKSVSVLLGVGDERIREAILAAQDRATRAGLDYLERHECFARRGTDGVNVIPAEGFVGAAFVHEMSRSGDPHLHTHVVIANRVRAGDGRWTAPDMRPVYAAAKTAGTIAEAVLRDELARSLGIRWGPVVNGTAEIAGIRKEVLEHFSQRHAEITELALARGWITQSAIAEIQRETRDKKPVLDRDVAQARWRARAAEHGLTAADITNLLGDPARQPSTRFRNQLAEHLAGPKGLTLQESTFTRRAVLRAIAEAHQGGISERALTRAADAFLADHGVPVSPRVGHEPPLYTTPDMLATEARLIEVASAKTRRPIVVPRVVTELIIAKNRKLGPDQADAVRHLTSGNARTRLLEARAGYGKTTALRAVREAYEAKSITVIGAAWQGQAARELESGAGIKSNTAASYLSELNHGREPFPKYAVVVVDEAGMMPTRALGRIADEVARQNGRLILVGDRDQLPSIDAGGAFASLGDRLGVAHLQENRRQRTQLQRDVATRLAEGKADAALALLQEHGWFTAYDDARPARKDLIHDWSKTSLKEPHRALILAHDRRDVAELNKLARDVMDSEGRLGKRRITASGREWAVGDRLVCLKNDYAKDLDVRNGTRGTVIKIHPIPAALAAQAVKPAPTIPAVTIRTDDGRVVRIPHRYMSLVDYAYASTGHKSQGATVDRTFLLATPGRGGREWAYVAGSRHRMDLRVYAVHHDQGQAQEELERTWLRIQAKTLAMDRIDSAYLDHAMKLIAKRDISAPHQRGATRTKTVPRTPTDTPEPPRKPRRPARTKPMGAVEAGRLADIEQFMRERGLTKPDDSPPTKPKRQRPKPLDAVEKGRLADIEQYEREHPPKRPKRDRSTTQRRRRTSDAVEKGRASDLEQFLHEQEERELGLDDDDDIPSL